MIIEKGSEEYNKIRESLLKFAESRGYEKTYCPSEVAREQFPGYWRDKMDDVRKIADDLCEEGLLVVLQKSIILKILPSQAVGPIRLQKRKKK